MQNRHKIGYENPILSESTLTNDKIALKYTVLFLLFDADLIHVFCIANIEKNSLFNLILSQAPKYKCSKDLMVALISRDLSLQKRHG